MLRIIAAVLLAFWLGRASLLPEAFADTNPRCGDGPDRVMTMQKDGTVCPELPRRQPLDLRGKICWVDAKGRLTNCQQIR